MSEAAPLDAARSDVPVGTLLDLDDLGEGWQVGILHSRGWEGVTGLLVPGAKETPEAHIRSRDLSPQDPWRLVRCRRATLPERAFGDSLFFESLIHNLEEWIQSGAEPDWHGPYGEEMIQVDEGAEAGLVAQLTQWARARLLLRAWEIHPDDRGPVLPSQKAPSW